MTARQREVVLVAALALPPAVVAALVAAIGGVVAAVVTLVGVAAALTAWMVGGAEARVRRAFAGRPADRVGEARALNLLEGLCFTAGLRLPDVTVVADEGANLAVFGRRADRVTVVVTSGLLGALSRIQLEGVLAAALAVVRSGELAPATLVASIPGVGRRLVASVAGRDEVTDAAAVGLTRFPPGLAAALDAVAAVGSEVATGGPDRAHLWLVDPTGRSAGGRSDPRQRAEALREL